jgi:diguanylate cyclase (GGDEF)-like protein
MIEISSQRQALRHTAIRVVVAVSLTVVLTLILTLATLGTDLDALVRVGHVLTLGMIIGIVISSALTGALTYRSAVVMRELFLARTELLRISRTDQLTGLLNRRGFDETAVIALTNAHGANISVAALMCDIDRFKAINDQFGHEFGDKVLVQIAEVFGSFARENGMLVARHGGEEFAVLMLGATVERAMEHANALRRACAATEILYKGESAYVTISIGLTVSHGKTDLPQIMRVADQALYAAKHRGRDRVAQANISDLAAA